MSPTTGNDVPQSNKTLGAVGRQRQNRVVFQSKRFQTRPPASASPETTMSQKGWRRRSGLLTKWNSISPQMGENSISPQRGRHAITPGQEKAEQINTENYDRERHSYYPKVAEKTRQKRSHRPEAPQSVDKATRRSECQRARESEDQRARDQAVGRPEDQRATTCTSQRRRQKHSPQNQKIPQRR